MYPVGYVKEDLKMAQHDDHEPAEGNAGMHVPQQLVALPEFYVYEYVAEDVPAVFDDHFGIDERQEELETVFP